MKLTGNSVTPCTCPLHRTPWAMSRACLKSARADERAGRWYEAADGYTAAAELAPYMTERRVRVLWARERHCAELGWQQYQQEATP